MEKQLGSHWPDKEKPPPQLRLATHVSIASKSEWWTGSPCTAPRARVPKWSLQPDKPHTTSAPSQEAGRRRYGIWTNAGESREFHTFHPSTVREVGADGGGAAAPDRGLQGLLQELGLSQLVLPLIKAMGPHNLEDQMQYTKLNTRAVDSLDVRGIP